jgi:hypothetical protein
VWTSNSTHGYYYYFIIILLLLLLLLLLFTILMQGSYNNMVKGRVCHTTDHEDPEGE